MKFQNIVLIGGGVLGSQIAYQTAYAGFHTTVYLRSEASGERAKPKVARLHEIYRAELTAAGASYTGLPLTIDGNIVTGEALGAAIPFALALARLLASPEARNKVKNAIVYQ